MHNHQTVEALLPTFPFDSPSFTKLLLKFCQSIFEKVAASGAPGFIYTLAWDLNSSADAAEIASYCEPSRQRGARVFFAELSASLETRLTRNRTELRVQNKASKRDVATSEARLIRIQERTSGREPAAFFYPESYLKIVNDHLSVADAVQAMRRHFDLPVAAPTPASAE